jgi:hypothetical protein
MKKSSIITCCFVLTTSNAVGAAPVVAGKSTVAHEEKQVAGFLDVPVGHWAYDAISRLCDCGIIEADRVNRKILLTRYEFAVLAGRLVKPQQANSRVERKDIVEVVAKRFGSSSPQAQKTSDTKLSKEECADILIALCTEFETELNILGVDYRSWQHCPAPFEKRKPSPTTRR